MSPRPLLEARGVAKHYRLGTRFGGRRQTLQALDDVSLVVLPGETLGLVGESGCGKSTLGRALLRLGTIDAGQILFEERDITRLSERALRRLRPRMQMVFQDSFGSLNPRRQVGDLLAEPMRVHRAPDGRRFTRAQVASRLEELLALVGLPAASLARYPREFSGGQRQRINIARALALSPRLVVADEPVSALDVSIQAQIINLFADLRERLGLTYVFIAHDLSVVRQIADRVAVMYLGTIVELGVTDPVLHRPAHPYTAALVSAIPEPTTTRDRQDRRILLRGDVPSPVSPPSGCRFHTRCPVARLPHCRDEVPRLQTLPDGRQVACHYPLTEC